MPIAKKAGLRLKKIREAHNISMASFAQLLGIKQPSLSRIESGKAAPSAKTLATAYEKLEIDPLWILTGENRNSEIKNPIAIKIGKIVDKLPEEIQRNYLAMLERELLLHKILEEQQEIKKASSE